VRPGDHPGPWRHSRLSRGLIRARLQRDIRHRPLGFEVVTVAGYQVDLASGGRNPRSGTRIPSFFEEPRRGGLAPVAEQLAQERSKAWGQEFARRWLLANRFQETDPPSIRDLSWFGFENKAQVCRG